MNNLKILTISFVTLILLNLLGSIIGAISLLLTPVFIGFVTYLILYRCNYDLIIKTSLIIFFIITNDILIRFYAGGTHDFEGNGFNVFFMFIGLAIFCSFFLKYGISNKLIKWTIINLTITVIVFYFYLTYCGTLGLVWEKSISNDLVESKIENLFVTNLIIDDNIFIYKSDSINVQYGWIEKEIQIDNSRFKKKTIETKLFNVIIKFSGRFDESLPYESIYYKVGNNNPNGAAPIEKTISFRTNDLSDTLRIFLFKNDAEFKCIGSIKLGVDSGYRFPNHIR